MMPSVHISQAHSLMHCICLNLKPADELTRRLTPTHAHLQTTVISMTAAHLAGRSELLLQCCSNLRVGLHNGWLCCGQQVGEGPQQHSATFASSHQHLIAAGSSCQAFIVCLRIPVRSHQISINCTGFMV